ncbi:MAG: cardiolipin synthase [Prevotella sp.]|nr:cardiolipin synthase [Prevotella sp.]MBQ2344270.1 cardiolipin synthase [Prevotella sp.]
MTYLYWIATLIYAVIVIGTIITVVMDNRQPVKTLLWIFVLLFMPVIGIILYFFFGMDTRKEKMISQRSIDRLTKRSMMEYIEQKDLHVADSHKVLVRLFSEQNWAFPYKDNEVDIFTDGYAFFPELLAEIAKAKDHIHLDTYIFEDDPLGRLVADALIAKAKEGVEVRVIYDDVGCWKVKNSFFERMREAGIDVHAFMPVRFPMFTRKVNYRNHRKICIIDGLVGFIGGMNIAMRYVKGTAKQPWRDTHLRIRGASVYGLQRAFLIDWYFVDRTLITKHKYYPPYDANISNNCVAQVVTSSPISEWPDIMQGYVRILLEAKRYVYIETPYFLPTEPVLFAMRTAALAGVDVRLMIPFQSDAKITEWATRSYFVETIKAGVKIYLYKAAFNHSKLLISDDSLSTCGSTNVDFRSFENNFESNIFFYHQGIALRLKKVFLDDQSHCILLNSTVNLEHRHFLKRFTESVIRLISPML